jgi:hypothetical protein
MQSLRQQAAEFPPQGQKSLSTNTLQCLSGLAHNFQLHTRIANCAVILIPSEIKLTARALVQADPGDSVGAFVEGPDYPLLLVCERQLAIR